ncbi:MAG: formate dehydrogenase accessory sulfurtransferase FdhD [Syntrophomonadaceae bacterium]
MADLAISKPREITSYDNGTVKHIRDAVVEEYPLTLFLNGVELATMVCSPAGFDELAAGFLLSEGLVRKPGDLIGVNLREEDGSLVIETAEGSPPASQPRRHHINTGAGKSGTDFRFINAARQLHPIQSLARFTAPHLLEMIELLQQRSATFVLTGGVHSAAIADQDGMICMFEDIGRHNAVDKVLGYAFLNEISSQDKILLLSGRIASEILLKAARARIPLVLSRSAPTGLTIDLAEELNITVVGFARGKRLSIYTHPERVLV